MSVNQKITKEQLERAISARVRRRIMEGKIESGEDIVALRNWEQGRRCPEGPALSLPG